MVPEWIAISVYTGADGDQPNSFSKALPVRGSWEGPSNPLPTLTHNSYQIAAGGLFARGLSKLNDSLKWNMTRNHFQARWEAINVQPWKKESFNLSSVLLTEESSATYSNSGESRDEQLMASASSWIRPLKSNREWGWLLYPSALIEIRLKYTSD